MRIGRDIAEHRGQDDARDFGDAERAAADDLAGGLEGEEGDGDFVAPHYLGAEGVEGAVDDARLDEARHKKYDQGLQREGCHQRDAA